MGRPPQHLVGQAVALSVVGHAALVEHSHAPVRLAQAGNELLVVGHGATRRALIAPLVVLDEVEPLVLVVGVVRGEEQRQVVDELGVRDVEAL